MSVAVRVIPCLDVDGGRVVKGVNFRELRDAGDPVELAAFYDAEGADELTFLDITASSGGRDTMYDVVRRTAEQVFIPLTVGGGVRSVADVRRLLNAGADKVSFNSAAVANPQVISDAFDSPITDQAGKPPLNPVSFMTASISSCSRATSATPSWWIASGSMSRVVNSRIFAR